MPPGGVACKFHLDIRAGLVLLWIIYSWTVLIILFADWNVFLTGNWTTASFVTNYIPIPVFFILYFGYKFWYKTSIVAGTFHLPLFGHLNVLTAMFDSRGYGLRFWSYKLKDHVIGVSVADCDLL
jgi:hypothetical protein